MYSVVVFYHIWCMFYEVVVFFDGACHRPGGISAAALSSPGGPTKHPR